MTSKPTHGGSRPNAGRNPDNYEKIRVVIPTVLKPIVKELCENWKKKRNEEEEKAFKDILDEVF